MPYPHTENRNTEPKYTNTEPNYRTPTPTFPSSSLTGRRCSRNSHGRLLFKKQPWSPAGGISPASINVGDAIICSESRFRVSEDTHYKEGYSEGYSHGLASGKDEGREVGLKTGFEVGEELGFYRGCIDAWNAAILVQPDCFSSRVQKSIKQMDELLKKYPISEPEKESVTDIMDSLRLKFRAICATLNVKLEYNGYPRASDVNNSGF